MTVGPPCMLSESRSYFGRIFPLRLKSPDAFERAGKYGCGLSDRPKEDECVSDTMRA